MIEIQHDTTYRHIIACCCLALTLSSCDQDEGVGISIKLFRAIEAGSETEPPDGFRVISFKGGPRAAAGQFFVAEEPIMTEWNILTFREATQADGSVAIVALLNEYARRKLGEFSADSANIKKPLALQVNGRCADISPLLTTITDKITLYSFTKDEAAQLQRSLETR